MTGPEHFRKAEALLCDQYTDAAMQGLVAEDVDRDVIALAQVHATLALAAATALIDGSEMPGRDWEAWAEAAGTRPAARPVDTVPTGGAL